MELFMILLGCKPKGRNTEQHDIYFGIAEYLRDLIPSMKAFWPEAEGKLHLDAWRKIRVVDGFRVNLVEKSSADETPQPTRLFFINLGGYKKGEFEEFHYKLLTAATNKSMAISRAKQTAFYKHTGFKGANSHVDDKYGIDVDDIYEIEEILPGPMKERFRIELVEDIDAPEDELNLGYFKLEKISVL